LTSLGHPCKFQRVSRLSSVTAATSLTGSQPNFARCLAVSWAATLYIHFLGILPPNGILPGAKVTLRPSLAFSYIASVTARHSSSGHQPNVAALSRGRHLYSAGRPSRWALAHILVIFLLLAMSNGPPINRLRQSQLSFLPLRKSSAYLVVCKVFFA